MADKAVDSPKKVPARNNMSSSALYKGSRADQLQNRDPAFKYEYKTLDEQHPHALPKTGQLNQHEHGTEVAGFVLVDGWQPVNKITDPRLQQAEQNDANGKPIDTMIRKGKQILCRLPKEEHAKYGMADAAYSDAIERQIFSPERKGDGQASMTAIVSRDANADQIQMLRNAGHNVPGIS